MSLFGVCLWLAQLLIRISDSLTWWLFKVLPRKKHITFRKNKALAIRRQRRHLLQKGLPILPRSRFRAFVPCAARSELFECLPRCRHGLWLGFKHAEPARTGTQNECPANGRRPKPQPRAPLLHGRCLEGSKRENLVRLFMIPSKVLVYFIGNIVLGIDKGHCCIPGRK